MRWWLLLLLAAWSLAVKASPARPVSVQEGFGMSVVRGELERFSTDSCDLGMAAVMDAWQSGAFSVSRKRSNIGYTRKCHWLYFNILHEGSASLPLYLEVPNPEVEDLRVYIFDEAMDLVSQSHTGADQVFFQRAVDHRNFMFRLDAVPGARYHVFIKAGRQPNHLVVPVRVWERSSRIRGMQGTDHRLGIFYGVMCLYIFIMTLMSYFLKDPYYRYYILLLTLGVAFVFIHEGLAYQFFWPAHPWAQGVVRYALLTIYLLAGTLFVRFFIRERIGTGRAARILGTGVLVLMLVCLPAFAYPLLETAPQFVVSIALSVLLLLVHIALVALLLISYHRSREKGLLLFLLAFTASLLLILFFTLVKFGLLPLYVESSRFVYSGGAAVAVIFTGLFILRVRTVIDRSQELRKELASAGTRYSFALLDGREKERKRVAEELHDGIGIRMSAIKMKLSAIYEKGLCDDPEGLVSVIGYVDQSCEDIREMSHELVPRHFERYGLSSAIRDLVDSLSASGNMRIDFRQKVLAEGVDRSSRLVLYRLVEGVLREMSRRKVERVSLKVIIIPSIRQASLHFKYIGRRVDFSTDRHLGDVGAMVRVLNGQIRWYMDTMWSNQLDIEVPVVAAAGGNEGST